MDHCLGAPPSRVLRGQPLLGRALRPLAIPATAYGTCGLRGPARQLLGHDGLPWLGQARHPTRARAHRRRGHLAAKPGGRPSRACQDFSSDAAAHRGPYPRTALDSGSLAVELAHGLPRAVIGPKPPQSTHIHRASPSTYFHAIPGKTRAFLPIRPFASGARGRRFKSCRARSGTLWHPGCNCVTGVCGVDSQFA